MYKRLLQVPENRSFFLFGARGTGKSTFLHEYFKDQAVFWVDLLDDNLMNRYSKNPMNLYYEYLHWLEENPQGRWCVIDEVQKIPPLLDIVHKLIFEKKGPFVLTGSSARKLKRGQANLLAGRAFTRNLYPLTFFEVNPKDNNQYLEHVLSWGSLPEVFSLQKEDIKEYLQTYCLTYLKEEVIQEQLIRDIKPFRHFMEVAGQMNGKIINYSKIALDLDIDPTTVKEYFKILEDTLIGFELPAFTCSIRLRFRKAPKFYLFDCGVARALAEDIDYVITPKSALFGHLFEQFIIIETYRLIKYYKLNFKMYFLMTKDDAEIDLVIEKNNREILLVEIKSKKEIIESDLRHVTSFVRDLENAQGLCVSNDSNNKIIQGIQCIHWSEYFSKLTTPTN